MIIDIFAHQMQQWKHHPEETRAVSQRQEETLCWLDAKGPRSLRLRKQPNPNGSPFTAEDFRMQWAKDGQHIRQAIFKEWTDLVIPSSADVQKIVARIPGAWAIQFTFTLASPYLSKGIEAFDLLDNPIIRDKVYEVPIVPASSWKGGLRAAVLANFGGDETKLTSEQNNQMRRLFGNERKADNGFLAGRLHCFPTGFQATRCIVINPHDRARRVGINPILLECVPEGQSGTFTALYVPFGDMSDSSVWGADLLLCVHAISDLLLQWGIGAKKSDGNGLAKDGLSNAHIWPEPPQIEDAPKRRQKGKIDLTNLADQMASITGEIVINTFEQLLQEAQRVAAFLKGQA
jgi:hypothetical protein